jgi:hypothetical protein
MRAFSIAQSETPAPDEVRASWRAVGVLAGPDRQSSSSSTAGEAPPCGDRSRRASACAARSSSVRVARASPRCVLSAPTRSIAASRTNCAALIRWRTPRLPAGPRGPRRSERWWHASAHALPTTRYRIRDQVPGERYAPPSLGTGRISGEMPDHARMLRCLNRCLNPPESRIRAPCHSTRRQRRTRGSHPTRRGRAGCAE